MDHALLGDASKGPGQDHDIEGGLAIGQLLSRTDAKANVSNTGLTGVLSCGGDCIGVGIDSNHAGGETRDAERKAAIAASEVENTLASHEPLAAPLAELALGVRSQRR